MGAAPAASVRVWRQLIVFTETILILGYLQCHHFVADAGASHVSGESSSLHVEDWHAWRNSKAGVAWDVRTSAAGGGMRSSPKTRINSGRWGSLRRRQVLSSYNDGVATRNSSSLRLEVEALTTFKAAITSDPLGALKSWHANDSDTCGWAGVVCSPEHPGHLMDLNLGGSQLVGNLNSALQEVGNLPFLERLDLSTNAFTGSIPAASLANCSNLSYLNVSQNQLSGVIPPELGGIVNLQDLDLGENKLRGEIPVSLGNCSLLRVLDLGSNSLEGDIPPVLGKLSRLEFLSLPFNSLSGSIPAALGNCSSLSYLNLNSNSNLGGALPPELSRLKDLQYLILNLCNFQGALPTWLGNLTALSQLYLASNQFVGVIPEEIGRLQKLGNLSLGVNNITGVLPPSITNCTALYALGCWRNGLTGQIPLNIGLLSGLQTLSIHDNSFSGVVPSSIANCSALVLLQLGLNPFLDPQVLPSWIFSLANLNNLYLNQMNLKGNVPEDIGKLSNLQGLHLSDNSFSGVIPSSLANCTLLNYLEMSYNQLTGDIPHELGLLTNMVTLNIVENSLSGSFPAFAANLTQIQLLAVGGNSLSGTIDCDFGRLSQLQEFYADVALFTGPIPETLGNCSQLTFIELSYNSLDGEIPPSLGNLTQLQQLSLGVNKITGVIPTDLMRCSNLGYLYLEGTKLEGNLPSNIGQLSFMQYLYLDHNNFSGTVPTSLGNCSSILALSLQYNQLTGSIPWGVIVEMSSSLTSLDLSHNLFSGSLPPEVSVLTLIQILDVSSNNLSGSIPASLGSCKALLKLDVSLNNLTGVIPPSLGLLPDLYFFNASYNYLEGPIPASGLFRTNITTASFLGNPGLCGTILGANRECPAAPAPSAHHNGTSKTACKGFTCKAVWIPTMCAVIGVLLIGAGVLSFWANSFYGIPKRNRKGHHLMWNFEAYTRISEKDVLSAVGGSDGENVIGVGSKSVVYKGVLPGGEFFAVKILPQLQHGGDESDAEGSQRESELLKEVHTLAKLRHRNIIKLLSFCSTLDIKAMIMEYMPEGSLYKHLHEQPKHICDLTWQTRFNIAVGVAEAMVYLHHDFPQPLIHGDLKPSNILLDTDLEPKVGDFGISKFCNPTTDGEATQSTVCGTLGYMPPEYGTGTNVSTKGDVYSYGVVLLEMLTQRPPALNVSEEPHSSSGDLRWWVMESFQERPLDLLDPTLKHEGRLDPIKCEQMLLLMRVALFCTRENPQSRPSMSDVLAMLTQIKKVGLAPSTPRTVEDLANDTGTTFWTAQDPSDTSLPSF